MISAQQNINKSGSEKRVLVAPLDWGLGHATRCIPIIRELLLTGCKVFIAAEKGCAALLQQEFPAVQILPLKGYRITYTTTERFFLLKMIFQIPKIAAAIRREHLWLRSVIKKYAIDTVISDNRFGMHSKDVHTVFITHQLHIKTRSRFTEKIGQKINYRFLNRFNECWVPDEAGEENLGGILSHPAVMPRIPVKYIGILSRFEQKDIEHSADLLLMLSGPEPQRTLFENILLPQISELKLKTTLVRGLPSADPQTKRINDYVSIIDHMPGRDLEQLIASSNIVIARSGFTTVMELAVLQKKAILVPTPGQNEQEYLAKYLSEKKYCLAGIQKGFDITNALSQLALRKDLCFPVTHNNARAAVKSLL